jgi:NAD(P)H-dependent FMN reductase/8-oxo-dGTP pyrophosphatase MutT (NUDIX family)
MTNQEYRDRVALWLHDNAGNLLVQDDRDKGLGLKFPGGGIDPGQSVNDAAIREALEEVGYALAEKPRAIPGVRARKIDWDPIFSAEAAAKGRNYLGSKHYHRIAPAGEPDESLLGSEGDALKANWMPIEEVLEATRSAAANPDNKYNYFDEERLNAAEKVYEMLNHKTASDETVEKLKNKLRVAILSGSTGGKSKSRALANAYGKYLTEHGADVDTIDMRELGDLPDVITGDQTNITPYLDRFANADAYVVSSPVYNWGPSGKVKHFLDLALNSDTMSYKPYSLLSGAGSPRSALALGGLANQLDMESNGIGIGAGVQAAGGDYDKETGDLSGDIVSRANENAAKLLQVAEALRNKTSSYGSPYMNAYLVGKKLAEAQFDDFNNVSDPDGYDVEVLEAANEDPKDFRSTRGREPQDPATNNYLSPKEKSNFARRPEEITSEDSYATNHPKRDNLRGYNNA